MGGPGSVVGVATRYGLDGLGIESRWGEIFRTCPERPWGPPSLLYNGYRVFPRGKEWLGRDADPSPPSGAMVKKEYSYTSTPPMGLTACTEPQCLYKGALYLCYNFVDLYLTHTRKILYSPVVSQFLLRAGNSASQMMPYLDTVINTCIQ
jgi:hypothetical protein